MEKYLDSIEWYQKCIELNPDEPVYHTNKALCFFIMDRYHESLDVLNESLELNPNSQNAIRLKGNNFKFFFLDK